MVQRKSRQGRVIQSLMNTLHQWALIFRQNWLLVGSKLLTRLTQHAFGILVSGLEWCLALLNARLILESFGEQGGHTDSYPSFDYRFASDYGRSCGMDTNPFHGFILTM